MQSNGFIGRRLGQYEIQAELGRGGMSRVYRAYQARLHRYVAIKVIATGIATQPTFRQRFEQEAQAIAQLSHPNIVAVYDFGEDQDVVYLVMQYVGGGTLKQRLGQPLPVSEAASYIVQMARALHHAHLHGVIHRDVKPANMLVDADDPRHLLLSDFGIAKLAGHTDITGADTTIGTPEYMAPEQAENRPVDARTDVYALGAVLYEALAGTPPFTGPSPVTVLYQQVHSLPAYVRGYNPEVPRELAQIVATALAKRPKDRFASAAELARALEPFARLRGSRGIFAPAPLPGATISQPGAAPGVPPVSAPQPVSMPGYEPGNVSLSPIGPEISPFSAAQAAGAPVRPAEYPNGEPAAMAASHPGQAPGAALAAQRRRERHGLGVPPRVDVPRRDMVTQFVLGLALVSLLIVFGLSWMLLSASQSGQHQTPNNQTNVSAALTHPTATPNAPTATPTIAASPTPASSTPAGALGSSVITTLYVTTSLAMACNPSNGLSQVPSGQQLYYFICFAQQSSQSGKAQVQVLSNGHVVASSDDLPVLSSWNYAYFFFKDPLPSGTYQAIVYWNGQAAQTATFTVQ
jgi:serine/threonine protein kinase